MAVLSLFSIFFISVSHVVAQQDKIVEILSVLTSRSGTTQMPYYQPTDIAEMSTQILPNDHQSGVNSYSTSLSISLPPSNRLYCNETFQNSSGAHSSTALMTSSLSVTSSQNSPIFSFSSSLPCTYSTHKDFESQRMTSVPTSRATTFVYTAAQMHQLSSPVASTRDMQHTSTTRDFAQFLSQSNLSLSDSTSHSSGQPNELLLSPVIYKAKNRLQSPAQHLPFPPVTAIDLDEPFPKKHLKSTNKVTELTEPPKQQLFSQTSYRNVKASKNQLHSLPLEKTKKITKQRLPLDDFPEQSWKDYSRHTMNLSHPARHHISPFQASSTISGMSKSPQNYVHPPAKADRDSSQTPLPSVSFSSSSSSLNFLQPQNHYISPANTDFSDDYFHSQNNEDSASDIIISDEDDSNSIVVLDYFNKKKSYLPTSQQYEEYTSDEADTIINQILSSPDVDSDYGTVSISSTSNVKNSNLSRHSESPYTDCVFEPFFPACYTTPISSLCNKASCSEDSTTPVSTPSFLKQSSSSGSASSSSITPDVENTSSSIPPVPFSTPPKLQRVEQVMRDYNGTDVASLRLLTIALARDAIFGKKEMAKKSLSGRKNTGILSKYKLDSIKTLVRSRVPNKPNVEFEYIWTLCRGSLSKSCQTLRNVYKKTNMY